MSKKTCTVLGIICLIICVACIVLLILQLTIDAMPTLNNTEQLKVTVKNVKKDLPWYTIETVEYKGGFVIIANESYVDTQLLESVRSGDCLYVRVRKNNINMLSRGEDIHVFGITLNDKTIVSFENYIKTQKSVYTSMPRVASYFTAISLIATVFFFCLGYGKFSKKKREKNEN